MRPTALVVGALGVVGRGLVSHLLSLPHWDVVALSRRAVEPAGRLRSISVDLLDPAQCRAASGGLSGVTHVFYVAYAPRPTHGEEVEPNLRMLQNLVEALGPVAPGLRHVCLMQGTKAYGAHLGPYKTPARETDPRSDMVCLHTGFGAMLLEMDGKPSAFALENYCAVLDGADAALLNWITDSDLSVLVADNYAVEQHPAAQHYGGCCAMVPLHEHCLFKLGIHLGELWHLTALAAWLRANGRFRFFLTAPPLRLPGAVGSPVTPVATV